MGTDELGVWKSSHFLQFMEWFSQQLDFFFTVQTLALIKFSMRK